MAGAIIVVGAWNAVASTIGLDGPEARAQGGANPAVPASRWVSRLESLRPQQPRDYFEVAEEIADAARNPAEAALAEHLFRLAGALDPDGLGRSACLALSDLAATDAERARYRLAAVLLDRRGAAVVEEIGGPADDSGPGSALLLSEAMSLYRRGLGPRVIKLLDQPGVAALLDAHPTAIDGGPNRIREDAKSYRGQARPPLRAEAITSLLRLEVGLLAGRDRPWSSDLLLTRNAPLPEVDPGRLDTLFDVDATRSVYRGGAWVVGR